MKEELKIGNSKSDDFGKLFFALIFASIIIAFGMTKIVKQERTVTVRGLAEREVEADLAIWPLSFSIGSDDLADLQSEILEKTNSVSQFLKNYYLDENDFTIQAPSIKDNSINLYIDQTRVPYKFIAEQTILIRSAKVQNVKNAQSDSLKLAENGIVVSQDYDTKMTFEFTALNDIKPEMIKDATNNARLAAEQFAKDSDSHVGKIKTATQGFFSIEDAAIGLEEKKKIRVVTTVEYLLK